MSTNHFLILILFLSSISMYGQKYEIIYLENSSFEDVPGAGNPPRGWNDCGQTGETPPDVQPYGGFNVTRPAADGNTYLGLVTRDNDTWEGIGQKLTRPLKSGECYRFSLKIARSSTYVSPTKKDQNRLVNFEKSATIRLWGGNSVCDTKELLASTDVIEHSNWKTYTFKLYPKQDYSYLRIEAYYKTPTLFSYNGNVLIDAASELVSCHIPQDEIDPNLRDPRDVVVNDEKDPTKKRSFYRFFSKYQGPVYQKNSRYHWFGS